MLKPDLSTPALCREYLSFFTLDGERIGYLINPHTKEEVRLQDATDEMVTSAAHILFEMSGRQKDEQAH